MININIAKANGIITSFLLALKSGTDTFPGKKAHAFNAVLALLNEHASHI